MAGKKKIYDPIKMIKAVSRATIGEMPKPKVVLSKKHKAPKYKETFDESSTTVQ
jgi:hypothetical protein